jgi:tetratricopeptide (TPR) repeat protein
LLDGDPQLPRYQEELAQFCLQLGHLAIDQADQQTATQNLRTALTIAEDFLVVQQPDVPRYRRLAAAVRVGLGLLAEQMGDSRNALVEYGRAIATLRAILDADPDDLYARDALATARETRADARMALGLNHEGQEDLAAAVQLRDPAQFRDLPEYRHRRLRLLLKLDPRDGNQEAIRLGEALAKDCPDHGGYAVSLAAAYVTSERFEEAIEVLQSIDLQFNPEAGARRDFWLALAYSGRMDGGDSERAAEAYRAGKERMSFEAPGNLRLQRLGQMVAETIGIEQDTSNPQTPDANGTTSQSESS